MKNYILIVIVLFFNYTYANDDKVIEKVYGNVKVTAIASNYVEEINKALIIAQYAENLAKKHSYTDKIYLYFIEEQIENPSIKSWLPNKNDNSENIDGVNIMFKMRSFDVQGCLIVIENSLLNKTKLGKIKDKISKSYDGSASSIIMEVLKVRVNRPNVVKELEKPESYSYYYQDNNYHFIDRSSATESLIAETDKVVDFYTLKSNLLVIFTNVDEFKFVKPKSEIKTLKIDDADKFYRPYKIGMLGNNKILFEFPQRSEKKERVMVYFVDENKFIQDISRCN